MWASCETLATTVDRPHGLSEPPSPPWVVPSGNAGDFPAGAALAGLADSPFSSRFWSWTGRSGRRYVFSVYSPSACPAFCHAVLLLALRDGLRRPSILSVRDTGAFPEPVVARAQCDYGSLGSSLEFHVHLPPSSDEGRAATMADLTIAGP